MEGLKMTQCSRHSILRLCCGENFSNNLWSSSYLVFAFLYLSSFITNMMQCQCLLFWNYRVWFWCCRSLEDGREDSSLSLSDSISSSRLTQRLKERIRSLQVCGCWCWCAVCSIVIFCLVILYPLFNCTHCCIAPSFLCFLVMIRYIVFAFLSC